MPTPTAHGVPLFLEASDWFKPTEGRLEIPPGILEGQTITIPGRFGALIAQPTGPPSEGKPFRLVTQIRFHAQMPGINWSIRDFDGVRDVMLSYPIEFVTARWANSVVGGRQIKIIWEVCFLSLTRPLSGEEIFYLYLLRLILASTSRSQTIVSSRGA